VSTPWLILIKITRGGLGAKVEQSPHHNTKQKHACSPAPVLGWSHVVSLLSSTKGLERLAVLTTNSMEFLGWMHGFGEL
jgi:hypothetical protein